MGAMLTVIQAGDPWPTVWLKNPSTGFREPLDVTLGELVLRARTKFIRDGMNPPERLLVPVSMRTRFLSMFLSTANAPAMNDQYAFLGMRVEWANREDLAIC